MTSWEQWLREFIELDLRAHIDGPPLSTREQYQLEYLRNLMEAAMGTKDTLMEDNRRAEHRIPVALPVSLDWGNGALEAFTVNIGWGGLQVDESASENVADLFIKLVIEREGIVLETPGRIVWRNGGSMGIAFNSLSLAQKRAMGEIMSKTLTERLEETVKIGK